MDHSCPLMGLAIAGSGGADLFRTSALCVHAKSLQWCTTLCDPMDSSLRGSSFHGIFWASILEWAVTPPAGDLPDPGIKPESLTSPALAGRLFTTSATWDVRGLSISYFP